MMPSKPIDDINTLLEATTGKENLDDYELLELVTVAAISPVKIGSVIKRRIAPSVEKYLSSIKHIYRFDIQMLGWLDREQKVLALRRILQSIIYESHRSGAKQWGEAMICACRHWSLLEHKDAYTIWKDFLPIFSNEYGWQLLTLYNYLSPVILRLFGESALAIVSSEIRRVHRSFVSE